jgi:hypothetical protein
MFPETNKPCHESNITEMTQARSVFMQSADFALDAQASGAALSFATELEQPRNSALSRGHVVWRRAVSGPLQRDMLAAAGPFRCRQRSRWCTEHASRSDATALESFLFRFSGPHAPKFTAHFVAIHPHGPVLRMMQQR